MLSSVMRVGTPLMVMSTSPSTKNGPKKSAMKNSEESVQHEPKPRNAVLYASGLSLEERIMKSTCSPLAACCSSAGSSALVIMGVEWEDCCFSIVA